MRQALGPHASMKKNGREIGVDDSDNDGELS
jgi:hypothetical protein